MEDNNRMEKLVKYTKWSLIAILIGYYPITWIISQMVHYTYESEETYEHRPILVDNIKFIVWTNPVTSNCKTSLAFPIIKRCDEREPFSIGITASDVDKTASKLLFNSVEILKPNKSRVQLSLVGSMGKKGDTWFVFRRDASNWVLSTHNNEELFLDDYFDIKMDFSVEKNGKVIREVIVARLSKIKKIRQGWVVLTSWLNEPGYVVIR